MDASSEMGAPLLPAVGELPVPLEVHLVAFFLFGLTGGLAAVKRHYDFIGLFVMAFATAAGGGLIRDGLFIQDGPALITQNSKYIIVIALSALTAVFFRNSILRLTKIIAWLDALGLGVYAVVGVQKALLAGLSMAAAVLVGVVTAAGGGLLRDLLAGDEPLMLKPGQFYVFAALTGCILYLLGLHFPQTRHLATGLAITAACALRILAIQFNWSTASVSRWDLSGSPHGQSIPPAGSGQGEDA